MRHACGNARLRPAEFFLIVTAPEENHRYHSSKRDRREADELHWQLAAKVSASIATADRTSPDQHGFSPVHRASKGEAQDRHRVGRRD